MNVTDRLIALILSRPEVTHLAGTRVFPTRAPQSVKTYPLAVVQMIDGGWSHVLDAPGSHRHPRVQVRCWAKTATDARKLADAVALIDGFRGGFGGLHFQGVHVMDEHEGDEPPENADDIALHYVQLDFEVWYSR